MNKAIVKMKGITKVFSTADMDTHALRGVNLQINKGEFVSICGPSGCGKSTLLSILGLMDTPTDGEYFIEKQNCSKLSLTEAATIRNEKIGFIFQSFNLIDELSVYENIALPLRYRQNKIAESEIKQRVEACLDLVEMSHRTGHKPNQLSGGQQQRIAISRALVTKPSLLLVDEPTGNLDSTNGDAVMKVISELNQSGTTICLVTHDQRYADLASRNLQLKDGTIHHPEEAVKVAV